MPSKRGGGTVEQGYVLVLNPFFSHRIIARLPTYCAENRVCSRLTVLETCDKFQRNVKLLLCQKASLLIVGRRPDLIKITVDE